LKDYRPRVCANPLGNVLAAVVAVAAVEGGFLLENSLLILAEFSL
jgi:hypothetical protein